MKRSLFLATVIVAGLLAVVPSVRAEEPTVFVVNEITVTDPVRYKTYADQVPATLAPFGGSFVVRGGNPEALDGKIPGDRVVVVAFPSRAQAKAWHESATYQHILAIRNAASTSTVYIVDSLQ
jgi:uncharacterized protein (DUF1330 family)